MTNFEDYLRKIWESRITAARAKAFEDAARICDERAAAHKRMCQQAADGTRDAILTAAWAVEAEECAKAFRRQCETRTAYVVRVKYPMQGPKLIGPFDTAEEASAVCATYAYATVDVLRAP